MKRINKLLAVLCLALMACVAVQTALPCAVPAALAESPLTADKTEVKLVKGEKAVVTLTFKLIGKIKGSLDNANVATCELGKKWDGEKTTLTIEGLDVGTATIKLTNDKTDDVLKIKVTVLKKNDKQETRTMMGKTVKSVNKGLTEELKAKGSSYDNGCFKVKRNSLGRINRITVYAGKGKYRLFSTYPGMKTSTAATKLKNQGWKRIKKSSSGDIYLNNTYPALALKLKAKGSKVSQVIFYVP